MVKKKTGAAAPPVVSFKEEIAGRETLTAIAEERGKALFQAHRDRTTTRHYGDRISNAPGAVSPKVARAMDTSPEVSVSLRAPGRETYAIIHRELQQEMPEIEITTEGDGELDDEAFFDTLEIERVHSFFIRAPLENFRSTQDRFRLVEQRLLRQMPGLSLDDITRIELEDEPGDEGVMVRVFARVLE
jgi:hypothetical protein